MREKIQNKVDEYLTKILEKDEITEREYNILKREVERYEYIDIFTRPLNGFYEIANKEDDINVQ